MSVKPLGEIRNVWYNIVYKGESMQITIVDISSLQSLVSQGGKPYKAAELTYKNEQGQIASKKIMEFDKLLPSFLSFKSGDVLDVVEVENGAYPKWVRASVVTGGSQPVKIGSGVGTPKSTSTYETSEERAKKQVYIVRQSSIGHAVNLLGSGAKLALVLDTAKAFEEYVFGLAPSEDDQVSFDDTFPDDIPY